MLSNFEKANWQAISLSSFAIQYLTGLSGLKTNNTIHQLFVSYLMGPRCPRYEKWEDGWQNFVIELANVLYSHKPEVDGLIDDYRIISELVAEARGALPKRLVQEKFGFDELWFIQFQKKIIEENYSAFYNDYYCYQQDSKDEKVLVEFPANVNQSRKVFAAWKGLTLGAVSFHEIVYKEAEMPENSIVRVPQQKILPMLQRANEYTYQFYQISSVVSPVAQTDEFESITFKE